MAMNLEDLVKKIKPKDYQKLIKKISLKEIYLTEFNSKVDRINSPSNNNQLKVLIGVDFEVKCKNSPVYICSHFKLDIDKDKEEGKFLSIDAKYNVVFEIKEEDIIEEFWELYKHFTLPNQIWPYFRELVQNYVSRMNLPPLTLPIIYK